MRDVIDQLLEYQATDYEALEVDRLLLRIFENPSLLSYLSAVGENEGKTELDFIALPIDAIESVKKLIGPVEVEVFNYMVNNRPHTGFRFSLKQLADINRDQNK